MLRSAALGVRFAALLGALLVIALPGVAVAQQGGRGRSLQPELRVDAILARRATLHAGVGANAPLGNYVRLEAVAAAGTRLAAGGARFSARGDLLARFLLDPFRQLSRGPYGGAGLSVQRDGGRTRGNLLAVVGVEAETRHGYAPALEVGLGGGVRLGVVLRRARLDRR